MRSCWRRWRNRGTHSPSSLLAGGLSVLLLASAVVSFFLPAMTENWVFSRCKEETERISSQIRGLHINTINSARRAANAKFWGEGQKTREEWLPQETQILPQEEDQIPAPYREVVRSARGTLKEQGGEVAMGVPPGLEGQGRIWVLVSTGQGECLSLYDWTPQLEDIFQRSGIDAASLCFDGDKLYHYGGPGEEGDIEGDEQGVLKVARGGKRYLGTETVVQRRFPLRTLVRVDELYRITKSCSAIVGGLLLALSAAAAVICARDIRRRRHTARSMERLLEQCRTMDPCSQIECDASDELYPFYGILNALTERVKELTQTNRELADGRRSSEMQKLQSQFNPHFVYNLLANLQYLIYADPEKARQVVVHLSKLLRYSVNSGRINVSLEADMQHVESYLLLQKSRYGARLEYSIHVAPELRRYSVPKLLIQPLIENAIVHNIDKVERLTLCIRAELREDHVLLQVEDDGQGIPPQRLAELNRSLAAGEIESDHIGLLNVHRTVQLEYGERYGVQIDSVYGHGTALLVLLPQPDRGTDNGEDNDVQSAVGGR